MPRTKPIALVMLLLGAASGVAQTTAPDSTSRTPFQAGGIYDRPYITTLAGNIAIGGYAEINTNAERSQGIAEGFSFEARRFNLFFYSPISERIKLTSELEFEHGTEEIKLETALIDFLIHSAINLRAGILLSPVGRFNITHDSPRYDIIDRPLVSTQVIPATLSEAGAGIFGALYPTPFDRLSYELYLTNGLQDGVVGGSGAGTRIPDGRSEDAFEEDNNGSPAITGRLAFSPRFGGEFGVSFHTGYYNTYEIEGDAVDDKRRLTLLAFDAEYRFSRLYARGEAALADIDVPEALAERFADRQWGFFAETGITLLRPRLAALPDAELLLVSRVDVIDLNDGTRALTAQSIGDETRRWTLGLSFRPTPETSFRFSYFREWHDDAFNNRSNSMNVQFGVATYF